MVRKLIKITVLTAAVAAAVGYGNYGREFPNVVRSAARVIQREVRQDFTADFELGRAKDLLDQVAPQVQDTAKLAAQQEAVVADLRNRIQLSAAALSDEKDRIRKLCDLLATPAAAFTIGEFNYNRAELTAELSRRFADYKDEEANLARKQAMLATRQQSLAIADAALDHARAKQEDLKLQIDSLQSRYALAQANGGGEVAIDNSALLAATRAVEAARQDLDSSRQMLARQSRVSAPAAAVPDEKELIVAIDSHLAQQAGAVAAK